MESKIDFMDGHRCMYPDFSPRQVFAIENTHALYKESKELLRTPGGYRKFCVCMCMCECVCGEGDGE